MVLVSETQGFFARDKNIQFRTVELRLAIITWSGAWFGKIAFVVVQAFLNTQ